MAGLDENGLTVATVEEIVADLQAAVLSTVSSSLNLGGTTLLGQIIGIFAERLAVLWELAEAVYSSQDPDAATGEALVQLAALTGTIPLAATASTVTLTLTGTPTTVVDEGSVAGTAAGVQFATLADATIAAATAWASATAYALGTVRRNASRIYLVTTAGTSAGSGGPTTADSAITDNTVVWRYLGEGTGYVDVESEATETGTLTAVSGTVTEIVTPVSGWSSVINVLDAEEGREDESNEELRVRREQDLSNAGTSPVDAIRSALLAVDGVTAVTVFQNTSDSTDGDGLPPHSVECLVTGGDDQDIWDALLASVAAGIQTHGDEDGTATDAVGNVLDFSFTRPDEVEIYVDAILEVDERYFPIDGETQVIAAVVAYGDDLSTGVNVRASALSARCFMVPGVLGATIEIGTAPSPSASTAIPISLRQRATFDTSRTTADATAVTP